MPARCRAEPRGGGLGAKRGSPESRGFGKRDGRGCPQRPPRPPGPLGPHPRTALHLGTVAAVLLRPRRNAQRHNAMQPARWPGGRDRSLGSLPLPRARASSCGPRTQRHAPPARGVPAHSRACAPVSAAPARVPGVAESTRPVARSAASRGPRRLRGAAGPSPAGAARVTQQDAGRRAFGRNEALPGLSMQRDPRIPER